MATRISEVEVNTVGELRQALITLPEAMLINDHDDRPILVTIWAEANGDKSVEVM